MLSKNQTKIIFLIALLTLLVLDCILSVDGKPNITLGILSWTFIPVAVSVYGPFAMAFSDLPILPKLGFMAAFTIFAIILYFGVRRRKYMHGKVMCGIGILGWLYMSMLGMAAGIHEL